MYLITNKEHLDELPLSLNELKGILSFRLSEFLKEYEVCDIVFFGAFIILEKHTEIDDFKGMMLTEPITADSIEWVETVKTDTKTYYNICIVRDDVFAVNIFVDKSITGDSILKLIGGYISENG